MFIFDTLVPTKTSACSHHYPNVKSVINGGAKHAGQEADAEMSKNYKLEALKLGTTQNNPLPLLIDPIYLVFTKSISGILEFKFWKIVLGCVLVINSLTYERIEHIISLNNSRLSEEEGWLDLIIKLPNAML